MTCDEARARLSALLDEALGPDERGPLEAHVATCVDCRRELGLLRNTVALLHSVNPVRAPAGFADRVLAAARPAPWYRRLQRARSLPWSAKLPPAAAAALLVGVAVAHLLEMAPELQRAARVESPSPAVTESQEPPATPTGAPGQKAKAESEPATRERVEDRGRGGRQKRGGRRDGDRAHDPPRGLERVHARAGGARRVDAGPRARRASRPGPRRASDYRVAPFRKRAPTRSGTSPALPCLTGQTPTPAGRRASRSSSPRRARRANTRGGTTDADATDRPDAARAVRHHRGPRSGGHPSERHARGPARRDGDDLQREPRPRERRARSALPGRDDRGAVHGGRRPDRSDDRPPQVADRSGRPPDPRAELRVRPLDEPEAHGEVRRQEGPALSGRRHVPRGDPALHQRADLRDQRPDPHGSVRAPRAARAPGEPRRPADARLASPQPDAPPPAGRGVLSHRRYQVEGGLRDGPPRRRHDLRPHGLGGE